MLDVVRPVEMAHGDDVVPISATHVRDNTVKRGHTISGVTAEAGAVFEHLLRRSHSDSSTSNSRHSQPRVSHKRLTVITETSDTCDIAHHIDDSTDNWTRYSVDTRLSSVDGLDEADGRPSHSSLQSADAFRLFSRELVDAVGSKPSTRIRLSSGDTLDRDLGITQSSGYFYQCSRDSADVLASSGVSGSRADNISDADDESKRKALMPKKKKSVFQRVRERLQATFSRDEDHRRESDNAKAKSSRRNRFTASFRRKHKKLQAKHGSENGSFSASYYPGSSINSSGDPYNHDREERKSKGVFSSLQRRFSTRHIKRSKSRASDCSATALSQSGDEINIHPVSESQQRILDKYVATEGDGEPLSRQGHHSIRARLELDIRQPVRPAADTLVSQTESVVVQVEPNVSSDLEDRVRDWDFIDGSDQALPELQHATTRRFSEKSPAEKEELYERIASQLISISNNYVNSPSQGNDSTECMSSQSVLASTHGMSVDLSATAGQLLRSATGNYSGFQHVVNEALRGESGLQQIAVMFQLSRAAIEYAGIGTDVAVSIKNMTIRYFEQYFAPWVVQQGGWESVVDSTDSELD